MLIVPLNASQNEIVYTYKITVIIYTYSVTTILNNTGIIVSMSRMKIN